MQVVRTIAGLRNGLVDWRRAGERIGLVPTMGALHAGHIALVQAARAGCGRVVATIFVNPKQFAPNEDLGSYPRPEAADLYMLQSAGVDLAFLPTAHEIYPPEFSTVVRVCGLSEGLCGAHRAGHFDGVATIVTKLLTLSLPDIAYFGEKDYQQLLVIRRLARDLDLPVRIEGVPVVREFGRSRDVLTQRLSIARRATHRTPSRPSTSRYRLFARTRARSGRPRDRARLSRPDARRVRCRISRNSRCRGPIAGAQHGESAMSRACGRLSRPYPTDR